MAEWKYGTILSLPRSSPCFVMVVGRHHGETWEAQDGSPIEEGDWFGITIEAEYSTAWPIGKTTWVPNKSPEWDWEVVSE